MKDPRLPLLIPSYNRPDAPLFRLAEAMLAGDYPWWVFVRKSQYRDYREFVHKDNLIPVADSKIGCVGDAHTYLMRWALKEGYDMALDWDDDIRSIGLKLEEGHKHQNFKRTGNEDPWFDGPGMFDEISHLSRQIFKAHPYTVAGSIQNQRWARSFTAQVQMGKTPRRTKIMHLERIEENVLWVPDEIRYHGDDIGSAALYLEAGWEEFTIGNLVYDFTQETDAKMPSTLRDRDEDLNRDIHREELENLMQYEIANYLRVTKRYEDGEYMYGDINWQQYRKYTGDTSTEYVFSPIRDRVPLKKLETIIKK